MGSADPPRKNGWKIKKRKHAKKSSFLCLCYILRAIRAGRCRERRYADHTFIRIYFRMHHFVVKFSKKISPHATRGGIDPPNQNPADVPVAVDRGSRSDRPTALPSLLIQAQPSQWRRQGEGGEASPLWVDVRKLCNMCVHSLSGNFFVSHDKYIARPSSKEPRWYTDSTTGTGGLRTLDPL